MTYLTTAQKETIAGLWHATLPSSSIRMLLDEIAAAIAADSFVKKITIEADYDDFTDNEDATGTFEGSEDIPAGATVIAVACPSLTGFAGDTSATITIGDGTDVDRYHTGTPNVFADAATGILLGAISGTAFHTAAKTPTLIVTTDSDFSSVSAGSIQIDIYYLQNNA